jgi:hypothetical protein
MAAIEYSSDTAEELRPHIHARQTPCSNTQQSLSGIGFPVYTYIYFNESQTVRRRNRSFLQVGLPAFQRFLRALDAPRPQLEGPIEIDELYVKAGPKGRERGFDNSTRSFLPRQFTILSG